MRKSSLSECIRIYLDSFLSFFWNKQMGYIQNDNKCRHHRLLYTSDNCPEKSVYTKLDPTTNRAIDRIIKYMKHVDPSLDE